MNPNMNIITKGKSSSVKVFSYRIIIERGCEINMKKHQIRNIAIVLFFLVVFATLAGCSSGEMTTEKSNSVPTDPPTPTETPIPTEVIPDRCVSASTIQFDNIQQGVKSVQDSNFIKSAWAVKSEDFSNVWIVAAYVYGPGMEDGFGPGLWAMNGDPDEQGMIIALDGTAKEFTLYPYGPDTNLDINQFVDGADEAKECAEKNK